MPGRQPERAYGLLGEGINDPILGEGTGEGGLDTGVGLKAQSPDVIEVTQMFSFAWQERLELLRISSWFTVISNVLISFISDRE